VNTAKTSDILKAISKPKLTAGSPWAVFFESQGSGTLAPQVRSSFGNPENIFPEIAGRERSAGQRVRSDQG
jgi:hypothetical protein